MKEVSLRDLAKEANVSIATVSRVLNDKPGVSNRLREKIIQLIHERKYPVATTRGPKTVGIICGTLQIRIGRYMAMALNELHRELNKRSYRVMIVSYENLSLFNENLVRGVVSLDFFQRLRDDWPNLKNIPLVCINDSGNHLEGIYNVCANRDQSMADMLKHLTDLGHSRIGFLKYYSPNNNCSLDKLDKASFLEAAKKFKIEKTCFSGSFPGDSLIHEAIGKLLLNNITALIVKGESFAPKVRHSLQLYQKRVPEDISVITNEDDYSCKFFIPGQTTMAYDFPQIAYKAVDMLEALMNGEYVKDVLVDFNFIERDSTGPCPS